MVLYPDIGLLNPSGICDGTTVVLYCGNSGETDPADPAGAKKGDAMGETSSLSFPLVVMIVWGPTYGVDVTYGTDNISLAVSFLVKISSSFRYTVLNRSCVSFKMRFLSSGISFFLYLTIAFFKASNLLLVSFVASSNPQRLVI